MSNEYPEIEKPYEEQKSPQRRKDDPIYHPTLIEMVKSFEKVLNLLKYTVIALFVAMALLYNIFTGDTTREDYQIRMLNDIILKLDDIKKNQNGTNTNQIDKTKLLERIINISHNTKQCGACHNENNIIKVYASWNFNDFKNYMRGIKRIPQNNIMPNYTSSELSDLDIEKMYEILKDGR